MPPRKSRTTRPQRWIRWRESNGITYAVRDDGRALANARRAAGLSQEALAAKVGCHKSYVGHLELDGGRVYRSLAEQIVAALSESMPVATDDAQDRALTLADLFDVPEDGS